jgi:hypothetical protein
MFITLISNDIQNILGSYLSKLNVFLKIAIPIWSLLLLTISLIIGVGGAFVILSDTQVFDMFFIRKMLFSFLGSDLLWKLLFYNFSFRAYQAYLLLPINSNSLFGYLLVKMTSGFKEILYLIVSFTFSLYLFNWSFISFLFIFMFFLLLNINSLIIMTLKYMVSYGTYSINYFLYLIALISITVSLVFQFSTIQKNLNVILPSILLLIYWLIGLFYTKKMMYKIMRD